MKLTARYLKPFWGLVLLCVLLLFGQAMSELGLPNLMSDMVNVGIQQGGLEAGAPIAMSQKAQALLLPFTTAEGRRLLEESYYTIEPESSEAQRLAKEYPLARREAICILRDGLEGDDQEALDRAYAQASYALLLYMQQEGGAGSTEAPSGSAQTGDRDSAPDSAAPAVTPGPPDGDGEPASPSLPEGDFPAAPDGPTAGQDIPAPPAPEVDEGMEPIPAGYPAAQEELAIGLMADIAAAEPAMGTPESIPAGEPDTSFGGFASGAEGYTGHESGIDPLQDVPGVPVQDDEKFFNGEDIPGQGQEDPSGTGFAGGLASMSAERLYQLLPLLQAAPQADLDRATAAAGEAAGMLDGQVGVALKKLFYDEIGLDTAPIRSGYIWGKGLQMLGVALLGAAAAVLVGLLSSRIAAAVGKRLRHDLFQKVMGLGGPELDRLPVATLITRTTNDVQQVQMLITMGLRLVCYAPLMGVGGVIMAIEKSLSMSWIVAAAVVAMLGLILLAMALVMPKFKALPGMMDALNRISREQLSGLMVVRAFGNQAFEEKRFREANRDFSHTLRFVQRAMAGMMPAMTLVMNLSTLAIMWVGGHAIAESALQIGDMMAFIQYAMQIIAAFLMIAMMFVMLPRASVSAARIQEVLDMPLQVQDPEFPDKASKIKGCIQFQDVSFRYGDAESSVLEHISFTARPGQTTAIIGATGAGKSTLVNLIPRFYDVTEGEILLDGVGIQKFSQADLRAAISYVPQKALLFSGSIEGNLRYGKSNAEESELASAIRTAQAQAFVAGMEKGLGSTVAQGGGNFSGGQRQRLAIARALVRKAPIYIFDDSFSALDFKTEAALRQDLRQVTENATVLVVAQRVSTIMQADQVIVLDNGRIAGKGTHKELLETCPEYREIAESQLRKEELA